MLHRTAVGVVLLLLAGSLALFGPVTKIASAGHEITNTEEKVNGDAARFNARRQFPDISGDLIVWQDFRRASDMEDLQGWWMKDLSTRSETAISIPNTAVAPPNISSGWVSWVETRSAGPFSVQGDVYARQLPDGPLVTISAGSDDEIHPHQDGATVAWQDHRDDQADIWKRSLGGGTQVRVTSAPSHESTPKVSGDTIIWHRMSDAGSNDPIVQGKTGTGPIFNISTPGRGIEGYSIHGDRIVWAEGGFVEDPCCSVSSVVMTCELPGCASGVSETVATPPPGSVDKFPDVSGDRIVWSRCNSLGSDCRVMSRLMSSPSAVEIDGGLGGDRPSIDGSRVVWATKGPGAGEQEGSDIYWRDLATSDPPRLANSRGMGETLGFQSVPNAAGNFVAYLAPQGTGEAGAAGMNRAFATDLTGDRRDFEVSTFTDLSTQVSPPRITASRASWRDRRNCPQPLEASCLGDVFERTLDPLGPESPATSTALAGNPPDVDGTRTAWICGETTLCLKDGGASSTFGLTKTTTTHTVDSQVRISGSVVLWSEFDQTVVPHTGVLHALETATGEDSILGSGTSGPSYFPSYDISGSDVVWAHPDGVYRNTTAFPCASSCDRSGSATLFSTDDVASTVSIDTASVVWDSSGDVGSEIRTQSLGESESHLLSSNGRHPSVHGDFVYWTAGDASTVDVKRESLSGVGGTLAADSAPPAAVTGFSISTTAGGASATLNWTNPSTSDLFAVRVMRKNGSAPTSVDDTSASIVFDGLDTSFVDTDRVPGVYYVYAAFPYDEVPNFGSGIVAGEEQAAGVVSGSGGTVSTGEPDSSDPVESSVTIPAGSASNNVTVTMTEAPLNPEQPPPPGGFGFVSQTVNIELDPPTTTFADTDPAILTLSYDDSILAEGQDESRLEVFTSSGETWEPVEEGCTGGDGALPLSPDPCIFDRDLSGNTITIKTTHFSSWALAVPPLLSPVSLAVDLSGPGDNDGSLEPGETVALAPSWTNIGGAQAEGVTGSLQIASCPPDASCGISASSATYGDVDVDEQVSCVSCYRITVDFTSGRTALHRDIRVTETVSTGDVKVWTIHVGRSFSDVHPANFAYRFTERVLHNEVTAGCGGTHYCPDEQVTRKQMAIFITRSLLGPGVAVPPSGDVPGKGSYNCSAGSSLFSDVPPGDFHCPHVHYMAANGITAGCSPEGEPLRYCPEQNVLRWQMAIFIAKAMLGQEPVPPAYTDTGTGRSYSCASEGTVVSFDDVPQSTFYCPHVHFLWANNVVSGTSLNPPEYSPNNPVTRGQMSLFLSLGFGLEAWD